MAAVYPATCPIMATKDASAATSGDPEDPTEIELDGASVEVSPVMMPSPNLQANTKQLYKIPLQPMSCAFGLVTVMDDPKPLKEVVIDQCRNQRSDVCVLFAVRRPGCGSCREHGEQLSQYVAAKPKKKFAMMGVLKERVDDEGILDFYQKHFRYPLYLDEKWKIYHAMGARKLNTMSLFWGFFSMKGRQTKKNITTTLDGDVGDHFMQGGFLIFDKTGELQYALEETFGQELNIEAIQAAVNAVRKSYKKLKHSTSSSASVKSDTTSSSTTRVTI